MADRTKFEDGSTAVLAQTDRDWLVVEDSKGNRAAIQLDPEGCYALGLALLNYARPFLRDRTPKEHNKGRALSPRETLAMAERCVDRLEAEAPGLIGSGVCGGCGVRFESYHEKKGGLQPCPRCLP